jgi:glycosyltransferase involved in cell wall biosynthesis
MRSLHTVPLVSIIIPVFNSERFLAQTLENALSQTWKNKEIVIVDDGSTDNSIAVAKSFKNGNIKIISVQNGGAARARNIGFANSKGEFIQYLDADDLMIPNKIELQIERLLAVSDPFSCVSSGTWQRFSGTPQNLVGGPGPGPQAEYDMSPLEWLLLRPYNLMTVHAWLTPRKLIEEAGLWNEAMTLDDDGEFFIRVVAKSHRVLACPRALTFYRTDAGVASLSQFDPLTSEKQSCEKFKSAYNSLVSYRNTLKTFKDPRCDYAIGRNFLFMAVESFRVCHDVYTECIRQKEIPRIQRFEVSRLKGGKFGLLCMLLGWRLAKILLMKKKANFGIDG